jgi:acetyl-CoA acetyltransferase
MTAAVAGVGYTPFTRASRCSTLELARKACVAALADAGLTAKQVDGIASFMVMSDSAPTQAVATVLGVPELRIGLDVNLGGQAPCFLVAQAAAAIESGQAETVLVYRAMNGRSGPRVGSMEFSGGAGQYRYPIGYSAYMMYVAMWAQRYLHETNQDEHDLAAVAIAQRAYAEANERAYRRAPLDFAQYLKSPMIVEPFRAADCTIEVDGACALVITSLDRARDLAHAPVVVASGGYRAGGRAGLDIGDHLRWEDYSRNYTSWIAPDLFGRAGVSPADVDIAEIYDCFSSTVLIGLEGLGLCGRGESGAFVRDGETAISGSLPTNTHGGLLAEGYLHGMNTVTEAVLQVQGRGGDRQAPNHEVCVVTSGALMDGSALILTADR